MRKRSHSSTVPSRILPDKDVPLKRLRVLPRKAELTKPEAVPQWLNEAATAFVARTPTLRWTGGFYSWGTWLDDLRQLSVWTTTPENTNIAPPWRILIDACKASRQVRGTAALYAAKSDLVNIIINLVFRKGEEQRLTHVNETAAAERDVMRRVRAVVTRQRRHEALSLTLIRFLDLAFVFSAFKDCRVAGAIALNRSAEQVAADVEAELLFLNRKPSAKEIRDLTNRMEQYMWDNRWLPWYEQVPGVRDDMVIRAREAALAFCKGLPFPQIRFGTGVRGLSRDHLAGSKSMDEWLLLLLDPSQSERWSRLSVIYESAVRDERGEEDPLLEETSRRVLQTVLEPLTELREGLDSAHSKLVDAAPGIIVSQSVNIPGRFTFRQLLELYIHLSMFGEYLHTTYRGRALPSIDEIHTGAVLYEEIRRRVWEVRCVINADKMDTLLTWCLATQELYNGMPALERRISYQQIAVKAAFGSAIIRHAANPNAPFPEPFIMQNDPLSYAAIVAEWDPPLAAKIVDAAVRIGPAIRARFESGHSDGLDLYTYRRVVVCDAARQRSAGDLQAAARTMARLHPVWDVCEPDKAYGPFDMRGVMRLQAAAEEGNFEASAVYGCFLCSLDWIDRRRQCGIPEDMERGIRFICKAVALGDTAAAADLMHLLLSNPTRIDGHIWEMTPQLVWHSVQCLKEAVREEPSMRLFVGYLYSLGATDVPVDCRVAAKAYQCVLESVTSSPRFQAYAANNLGVLRLLNTPGASSALPEANKAFEFIRASASAADPKAESNLGALLCLESSDSYQQLEMAKQTYWQCLSNRDYNNPVTTIQARRDTSEVNVYKMRIAPQLREKFCRELRAEGMVMERYGTVLETETVPYVPQATLAELKP
ncbi:unnamed protein product [Chondrus crispus]|uniref:Uncharacterized protein n=1 Tax=Chondrus crispus TaxID=2769 RepID=R7QT41_CHOCR|nr:unnamed protein product [Chondrus crispus]CDF40515.1 unnamed protein product [Chondrus crispus]|eukprot:XP_005710809.1 unnamed protein product [Chondrus crispus]